MLVMVQATPPPAPLNTAGMRAVTVMGRAPHPVKRRNALRVIHLLKVFR
jgi:hypothetical protein